MPTPEAPLDKVRQIKVLCTVYARACAIHSFEELTVLVFVWSSREIMPELKKKMLRTTMPYSSKPIAEWQLKSYLTENGLDRF